MLTASFITTVPSNLTVVQGSKAVLNCSVNEDIQAKLVWTMKNSGEIIPSDKDDHIEILPDGPLVFHNVRKEDQGFYQCSVKVNDTKASKTTNTHWAYLEVQGIFNRFMFDNKILPCKLSG